MAIISKTNNFIFTHIPKTAGSSIRSILSKYKYGVEKPEEWHESITETFGRPGTENFDKMFKFSFIRNPWDRMYSTYNFICNKPLSKIENIPQQYYKDIGFKKWLLDESFYVPNNIPSTNEMIPIQKKNLVDWIYDKDGKCVVDYIGRFETVDSDFKYIMSILHLPIVVLPKLAPSKRNKSYKPEFDNEMNDFIYRYHKRDIAEFDYEY